MSSESIQTVAALATLLVIVVGVTVAVVELRQEVLARRLQGVSALFSEVWNPDVSRAAFGIILNVKPGFADSDLTPEQVQFVPRLMAGYNRLGFLMHQGLVKEREVLAYPPFGILAAELFALLRDYMDRVPVWDSNLREQAVWWEYLAGRGEAYWTRHARAMMAGVPRYANEPMALMREWATTMGERHPG